MPSPLKKIKPIPTDINQINSKAVNEKITLPTIIQLLALRTGDTCPQAEEFVKELLAVISEGLQKGEQIKIKEFGIFKTIEVEARKSVNVSTGEDHEIPAHRKIVFIPSRAVAAFINAPFEMFETVELSEGVTFDIESGDVASVEDGDEEGYVEEQKATDEVVESSECAKEDEWKSSSEEDVAPADQLYDGSDPAVDGEEEESSLVYEVGPELDEDVTSVKSDAEVPAYADVPSAVNRPVAVVNEDEDEEPGPVGSGRGPHRFLYGFISGFGAAILIGLIIFFCVRYFDWDESILVGRKTTASTYISTPDTIKASDPDTVRISPSVLNPDSTVSAEGAEDISGHGMDDVNVPTMPSDRKVYDTITKTRYLTTMAKDHYGNFNLWPYIYKENEAFLGHPDRIRPGTQVVVPPLSKYGVDPKNPSDIAKAKRLGIEIYSRYK